MGKEYCVGIAQVGKIKAPKGVIGAEGTHDADSDDELGGWGGAPPTAKVENDSKEGSDAEEDSEEDTGGEKVPKREQKACPKCGAENDASAILCEKCEFKWPTKKCPCCDQEILATARDCDECG